MRTSFSCGSAGSGGGTFAATIVCGIVFAPLRREPAIFAKRSQLDAQLQTAGVERLQRGIGIHAAIEGLVPRGRRLSPFLLRILPQFSLSASGADAHRHTPLVHIDAGAALVHVGQIVQAHSLRSLRCLGRKLCLLCSFFAHRSLLVRRKAVTLENKQSLPRASRRRVPQSIVRTRLGQTAPRARSLSGFCDLACSLRLY